MDTANYAMSRLVRYRSWLYKEHARTIRDSAKKVNPRAYSEMASLAEVSKFSQRRVASKYHQDLDVMRQCLEQDRRARVDLLVSSKFPHCPARLIKEYLGEEK